MRAGCCSRRLERLVGHTNLANATGGLHKEAENGRCQLKKGSAKIFKKAVQLHVGSRDSKIAAADEGTKPLSCTAGWARAKQWKVSVVPSFFLSWIVAVSGSWCSQSNNAAHVVPSSRPSGRFSNSEPEAS